MLDSKNSYNTALVSLAILAIQYASSSVTSRVFFQTFGIFWCSVSNSGILLGPRLYALWTLGDDGAVTAAAVAVQKTQRKAQTKKISHAKPQTAGAVEIAERDVAVLTRSPSEATSTADEVVRNWTEPLA